jgi:hypothetical protein
MEWTCQPSTMNKYNLQAVEEPSANYWALLLWTLGKDGHCNTETNTPTTDIHYCYLLLLSETIVNSDCIYIDKIPSIGMLCLLRRCKYREYIASSKHRFFTSRCRNIRYTAMVSDIEVTAVTTAYKNGAGYRSDCLTSNIQVQCRISKWLQIKNWEDSGRNFCTWYIVVITQEIDTQKQAAA